MRAIEIICEKAVESSWITNLTYNRPNKIVTMRLNNGNTYSIVGVTRTTVDKWAKSNSKGQFWHNSIKNIYRTTRIS